MLKNQKYLPQNGGIDGTCNQAFTTTARFTLTVFVSGLETEREKNSDFDGRYG